MKLPIQDRLLSSFGVFALVVILAVLAILQYRWSRELNDAASDRMRAGLHSSMMGLREDLNREFSGLSLALQFEPSGKGTAADSEMYVERIDSWRRATSHPGMVANVFVLENSGTDHSRLLRLNTVTRQFESVQWPGRFEQLHEAVSDLGVDVPEFAKHLHDHPPKPGDGPGHHFLPRVLPWIIEQGIPAILHPQLVRSGNTDGIASVNWVIIELDQDVIERSVLPELAQKYFAGPQGMIYDVAVVSEGTNRRLIYSSNAQLGTTENAAVDAKMYLFGPPNGPGGPREAGQPGREPGPGGEREFRGQGGPLRLMLFRHAGLENAWVVVAKHRKGSLEAALASIRRRHMAVSFGILLMLAITLAMIIAATRRAQRLARLQMDFVTGVSHELRTPLAVITSAADNIANGIIDDKRKLARYGEVIRNQSRQLSHLVEQILLFAATRQERYQYSLTSVHPGELVERALRNSAELIRTAGVNVEQDIEPKIPAVLADVPAVSHCIQNLIINAVKYGGESRWIGIRARAAGRDPEREVQISVADKGIGIEEASLARIFDPFYRSPAVVSAQIHGTGLGLALAKGVAESMGGRLTVKSKSGVGTTFTLHLRCAPEHSASETNVAAAAAQGTASNE